MIEEMLLIKPRLVNHRFLLISQSVIAAPEQTEVGENNLNLAWLRTFIQQTLPNLFSQIGRGRHFNAHTSAIRQLNRAKRLENTILVDGFDDLRHSLFIESIARAPDHNNEICYARLWLFGRKRGDYAQKV